VHRALSEYPFEKPMGLVRKTWQLAKDGTGRIGFVLRVVKARNATAFSTLEGNCGNRVKVGCRQMDQSILVGFVYQYSAREKKPRRWKTGLVAADDSGAEGTR
jgi:hypothetical protein